MPRSLASGSHRSPTRTLLAVCCASILGAGLGAPLRAVAQTTVHASPAPSATKPTVPSATAPPVPSATVAPLPSPLVLPSGSNASSDVTMLVDRIVTCVPIPPFAGATASLVFPTSDADSRTTIHAEAFAAGRSPLPPVPPSDGTELATLRLSVSRTTTFRSLPTLYFAFATIDLRRPLLVEMTDANGRVLERLDQFPYSPAAFVANLWPVTPLRHPLRLQAGRPAFFRLVADPPSMLQYISALAPLVLPLPSVDGIAATITTPPVAAGGGRLIWRVDREPPFGVPPFGDGTAEVSLGYATLAAMDNVTYDGNAHVSIAVPASIAADGAVLGLAAYDTVRFDEGWHTSPAWRTTVREGRAVFDIGVPQFKLSSRRFVAALYRAQPPPAARATPAASPTPAPARGLPVAVTLGDSVPFLTELSVSPIGCRVDFSPLPSCQFDLDPALTYGGLVGQMAGLDMRNLANPGAQSTVDFQNGESILKLEIPRIPVDAVLVIFGGGVNDAAYSTTDDVPARVDAIDAAIRARAPHAHVAYVGMRYFNDTIADPVRKPLIDAWNERERQVAARHGDVFVDVNAIIVPGRSPDSPDGAHYTLPAQRKIAAAIAAAVRSLLTSSY